MKIRHAALALAAATLLLSGCAAGPEPEPALSVEPVPGDATREASFEEFADYFSDLDTDDLAGIPDLNVTQNDRQWVLGSGTEGYILAFSWAQDQTALERDGEDAWEGIFATPDRAIMIFLRDMGDQQFILQVTAGE